MSVRFSIPQVQTIIVKHKKKKMVLYKKMVYKMGGEGRGGKEREGGGVGFSDPKFSSDYDH